MEIKIGADNGLTYSFSILTNYIHQIKKPSPQTPQLRKGFSKNSAINNLKSY